MNNVSVRLVFDRKHVATKKRAQFENLGELVKNTIFVA